MLGRACHAAPDPLGSSILTAKQVILIDTRAQQTMPAFYAPVLGKVGPFIKGQVCAVPLSLVNLLASEGVAYPIVPAWLAKDELQTRLKNESDTTGLLPCPHPYYIEIADLLANSPFNAWAAAAGDPGVTRRTALQLFADLVSVREAKISQVNESLVRRRCVDETRLSVFERRKLHLIAADYMKKLEQLPSSCNELLEQILTQLEVFDPDEHFYLLEESQSVCAAMLEELGGQEDDPSPNR